MLRRSSPLVPRRCLTSSTKSRCSPEVSSRIFDSTSSYASVDIVKLLTAAFYQRNSTRKIGSLPTSAGSVSTTSAKRHTFVIQVRRIGRRFEIQSGDESPHSRGGGCKA